MTAGTGSTAEVQRRLLVTLAAASTWTVGLGALAWGIGRREEAAPLRSAGRAAVAWGVLDAGAVGWRAWRQAHAGADSAAQARESEFLAGVGAALDLACVAGGA